MMFDIIEGTKEWLEQLPDITEDVELVEEQDIRKTYDHYTTVTPEIFVKWKAEFDQEMRILREQERERLRNLEFINGLTY